jgi:hypothetical protein
VNFAAGLLVDITSLIVVCCIAWWLFRNAGEQAEQGAATVVLMLPTAPLIYAVSALAAMTAIVQTMLIAARLRLGVRG